ncbi:hypothetical protein [Streptomyces xanthochromogenes]
MIDIGARGKPGQVFVPVGWCQVSEADGVAWNVGAAAADRII